MSSATADQLVSDSLLSRYAAMIYDLTGIRLSPQKKQLLANRLRRRLRETGIASFEDYYTHLKKLPPTHSEWEAFLQEITTHETYLFRDQPHWDWLQREFLPQMVSSARLGQHAKRLRFWSAACSTGDEAFSIASCLAAALPLRREWDIKILGTDIGAGAVAEAKEARFGSRAMRLVPPDFQGRFFQLQAGANAQLNTWKAKPDLIGMTEFRTHNLMEPLREAPFDVVFLKNVLIYFDPPSKRKVVENVRKVMRPGSLLVAGAAEGVGDLMQGFERVKPWLFRRGN